MTVTLPWTQLPYPLPEMCASCNHGLCVERVPLIMSMCKHGQKDYQKCRSHSPKDGRSRIFNVILDEEQGGITA